MEIRVDRFPKELNWSEVLAFQATLNGVVQYVVDDHGRKHSTTQEYRGQPASCYIKNCSKVDPGPRFARPFFTRTYGGGRTEVFAVPGRTYTGDLCFLDVNSLYPAIMQSGKVYDPGAAVNRVNLDYPGWTRATVEVFPCYLGPLPFYEADNYIFPTGTWSAVFANCELARLDGLGLGRIHAVSGGCHYRGTLPRSPVIDKLYELKARAVGPDREALKMALNYGIGVYDASPKRLYFYRSETPFMKVKGKWLNSIEFHGHHFELMQIEKPETRNGIFKYVAALARCFMFDRLTALIADGAVPLYCDTDSICYLGSTPDSLKISDKLGDWKPVAKGKLLEFQPFGRKRYRYRSEFEHKAVIAGINAVPEQIHGEYCAVENTVIRLTERTNSRIILPDSSTIPCSVHGN